ncbi:MAG: hypothetical protein JOY73_05785 [Actinobacteria bacterium]|nr:hypothetical protein [Actinomycetota bacterium]
MILRIVSAPFRLVGRLLTGIGRRLSGRASRAKRIFHPMKLGQDVEQPCAVNRDGFGY